VITCGPTGPRARDEAAGLFAEPVRLSHDDLLALVEHLLVQARNYAGEADRSETQDELTTALDLACERKHWAEGLQTMILEMSALDTPKRRKGGAR
jgi:hypothetical protein